jgi:hypothetical protein
VKKNVLRIHMTTADRPWCQVQTSHYQPPILTREWDRVTCQRCIDKRLGTGAYAGRGPTTEGER